MGEPGTAGSPTTPPSRSWRHAGGDSDGECDACWAELDLDETEPRSEPHEAAPDLAQALWCYVCGHDIEAVPA